MSKKGSNMSNTATNAQNPIEAALKNDTRLDDAMKQVKKLGEEAASGKDSLPKLAVLLTRLANDGVIDLEKKYSVDNGNGGKRTYDDAEAIFTRYAEAENKKAIHERSNGGLKANISKARQFVELGMMTAADGPKAIERAFDIRNKMLTDGDKVKSAYAAYVDVARAQKALDRDITDDELREAIRKREAASPEALKVLKGVMKKLEDLIAGEKGAKDNDSKVEDAFNAIRDRVAEIEGPAKAEEAEEVVQLLSGPALAALMSKLGYAKVA